MCVPVCAESLGDARSMNTSHPRILCRSAAKLHVSEGLHLFYGYHKLNLSVVIRIRAVL